MSRPVPPDNNPECWQPLDVRWQCPRGHFVAHDNIRSEDVRDPSAYYGVSTVTEYSCNGCNKEEPAMYFDMPRLVVVRHG